MKVSNKAQYGLRAMTVLAKSFKEEVFCSLREISEKENIPFDFLEKIAGELRRAGLIMSRKGSKGGYFLSKNPKKIKLAEIFSALDDESFLLVQCTNKNSKVSCPNEFYCQTKNAWQRIQKSLDSTLESIYLEELIKKD